MKHPSLIALTLILCSVLSAGTGALAQQVAGPSGAANATGATDSTLEIPPNYPQPADASATPSSDQPGNSDAGAEAPQTGAGTEVPPDAGTAQDYTSGQGSNAAPLPEVAGINDYMNQEATYEGVGTGLPPIALLPPPAYYPYSAYYYPRFYSPPPPILMMPPSRRVIASPKIRTPVHPPPAYHPPPPPPPPPPARHFSFGPPSGHRGFQHR